MAVTPAPTNYTYGRWEVIASTNATQAMVSVHAIEGSR